MLSHSLSAQAVVIFPVVFIYFTLFFASAVTEITLNYSPYCQFGFRHVSYFSLFLTY